MPRLLSKHQWLIRGREQAPWKECDEIAVVRRRHFWFGSVTSKLRGGESVAGLPEEKTVVCFFEV